VKAHGENAIRRVCLAHAFYQQHGGEDAVFRAERDLIASRGIAVEEFTANNADFAKLGRWLQPGRILWNKGARHRLRDALLRSKAQVLHCHNLFPAISFSAYAAAADVGIPVLQTLHNFRLVCANAVLFREGKVCESCVGRSFGWPGVMYGCYRGSRASSAVIASMSALHRLREARHDHVVTYIALTDFAREKFIEGGLPSARIVVKPNFVPTDPGFVPDVGGYALFVGRLSPEKGIVTLLRAWKEVDRDIPLRVVGEGPLSHLMSSLPSHVRWLGQVTREEVCKLMAGARFLVFPSECYENFPLVLAEAFATGLPVIASAHGAALSIVDDARKGVHFRLGVWGDVARRSGDLWMDA